MSVRIHSYAFDVFKSTANNAKHVTDPRSAEHDALALVDVQTLTRGPNKAILAHRNNCEYSLNEWTCLQPQYMRYSTLCVLLLLLLTIYWVRFVA